MLTIPVLEFREYSNNHAKNNVFSMARGYVTMSEPNLIQADSYYPKNSEEELNEIFNHEKDESRKVHVSKGCIRTTVTNTETNSSVEIRQEGYLVCEEKSKASYLVSIVLPSLDLESGNALVIQASVSIQDLGTRGRGLEYYAEKMRVSYFKMVCCAYIALCEDLKALASQVGEIQFNADKLQRLEPLFKKALCGNNERVKWTAKKATRADTHALYNNCVRSLVQAEIGLNVKLGKMVTDMHVMKRYREKPDHFESFLGKEATNIFNKLIAEQICISYMERLSAREVDILWNLIAARQFIEAGNVLHGFGMDGDWMIAERPALMALCGYDSSVKRQVRAFTDMIEHMKDVRFQHIEFHPSKDRKEDSTKLVKKESLEMVAPFGLGYKKAADGTNSFMISGLSLYAKLENERGYEDFSKAPARYIIEHTSKLRGERLVRVVNDILIAVRRRDHGYTVENILSAFELKRGRTSKDISDLELIKRALQTANIAVVLNDDGSHTFRQLKKPELHRFIHDPENSVLTQ